MINPKSFTRRKKTATCEKTLDYKKIIHVLKSLLDFKILLISVITIFAYSLLYLFFYGYYLGSNPSTNIFSLILPLNFKVLSSIGILFIIIFSLICYSLYRTHMSLKSKKLSEFILDTIMFWTCIILMVLGIHLIISNDYSIDFSKTFTILTPFFEQIYVLWISFLASFSILMKELKKILFSLLYSLCIYLISVYLISVLNINNSIFDFNYIFGILYTSCFLYLFFSKNKFTKFLNFSIILFTVIIISLYILSKIKVQIHNFILKLLFLLLIFIISFMLDKYLVVPVRNKIKRNKKLLNTLSKLYNNKLVNLVINLINFVGDYYSKEYNYTILSICIMVVIFLGSKFTINFGNYFSQLIPLRTNIISINIKDKPEDIVGSIIYSKDNLYYIITENKELKIIKTDYINIGPK